MTRGLNWQTVQMTLGIGLESKQDVRASTGSMDIARDVWFDELKGVQVRRPMVAMTNAIQGGGALANCRRLDTVGSELLVSTVDSMYSWNAQLQVWVLRGTNLAVNVTEHATFTTTGDQIDSDRAELNGTIVDVWVEGTQVFAAAADKATGSVLVSPTVVTSGVVSRPRIVALGTRLLLFVFNNSNGLEVRSIDPASPSTGIAGSGMTVISGIVVYDVVKAGTQDLCVGAASLIGGTQYVAFSLTPGLTLTNATKARVVTGPVAVATIPDGTKMQVIRATTATTDVHGDLLTTSTLADIFINQAIVNPGTIGNVAQIAACFRSVTTGGFFRCYVFISALAPSGSGFGPLFPIHMNFVDTSGALGTPSVFLYGPGIGSRAFDYNGQVYLWLTFGLDSSVLVDTAARTIGQAQNAYLLYRDDGFLVAKAVYNVGGGIRATSGLLPGVALTSGATTYSWAGTAKRKLALGGGSTGYAAREPHDITFQFDSVGGRRAVEFGKTLYIAAGEILQYDGVRIVEVGFHFYPWSWDMVQCLTGTGNVAFGAYGYKITWRWQNARGEIERSTTATIGTATSSGVVGGAQHAFQMSQLAPLNTTHKKAATGASAIAAEVWRTAVNADLSTPYFLATSSDPTNLTNPNKYIPNVDTANQEPSVTWRDEAADSTLEIKETNPENGLVLESLCPPEASIIIATDTRLFLAGIAGQPDSVWYSLLREDGQIAGFNDTLVIPIPPSGGDITALTFLNQILIVFRQTSIYALEGQGFDNAGGGSNYGPANWLAQDVGAISAESVAVTPMGVVFKSLKGWYLVDRGLGVKYIGQNVSDFDTDTVLSAIVVETQHHVRILTSNRMIIWDYFNVTPEQPRGQWSEATISDGVHATIWNGQYVYLTATGPKIEQTTYVGTTYGLDLETSWLKTADLQGAIRIRWFEVLGELRSLGWLMRIRVARDYQYDVSGNPVYYDDAAWLPSPTVIGSALQVRHAPSQGQCEAIKVRMTAVTDAVRATLVTTALSPQVTTSGTAWASTWTAATVGAGAIAYGEMGNAISMQVAVEDGTPFSIDVRDHFFWDHSLQRWREDLNNIGVRVLCHVGSSPTVAQLEAAIVAGTKLATLTTPDATPAKVIDAAGMVNLTSIAFLTGGTYGSPTTEQAKLTGLALEVGTKPGIFRRLPAAQKA